MPAVKAAFLERGDSTMEPVEKQTGKARVMNGRSGLCGLFSGSCWALCHEREGPPDMHLGLALILPQGVRVYRYFLLLGPGSFHMTYFRPCGAPGQWPTFRRYA